LIYCIFAYQGGRSFRYEHEYLRNALITKYASTKTVDTHLQDGAGGITLLLLPVKAAII